VKVILVQFSPRSIFLPFRGKFLHFLNYEQYFETKFISKTVSIEIYNILAVLWLLYGCKIWTLKNGSSED
jgi:hypothetical protein